QKISAVQPMVFTVKIIFKAEVESHHTQNNLSLQLLSTMTLFGKSGEIIQNQIRSLQEKDLRLELGGLCWKLRQDNF
ncbi:MAG: hypothetical protein JSU80_10995, partial [Deltaproteobacteria bacterium]